MKVFVSWSGHLSKQVAELLREWLPSVLQNVDVWVSSEDIEKGSLWFGAINHELADTRFGILCLTPDNIGAPWILFEAGALSKGLTQSRVSPLLIGLSTVDLRPPLNLFNGTLPSQGEMLKLVKAINGNAGENEKLPDERVQKAFDRWWQDFEGRLKTIKETGEPATPAKRPPEDILAEVLELVTSIHKTVERAPVTIVRGLLNRTGIKEFVNLPPGAAIVGGPNEVVFPPASVWSSGTVQPAPKDSQDEQS
jgi:hypothetical protein